MRNLYKPNRYNVASIQAQQTLGGDVMQSDENGLYVEWRDYKWLLDSYASVRDQWKDLNSEVERLKAVSTIEQRTIQGLQRTPEWSEIARLTAYCRELEAEVERLRKAGDEMARIIAPPTHGTGEWDGEWDAWRAAKEGKGL